MKTAMHILGLAAVLGLGGCFSSELDPNIEGAFSCSETPDCPAGQACDGSRCVAEENVPVMKVLSPEPNQVFALGDFPGSGALSVRVQGNLTLVEPADEVVPGSGYVELTVDGASQLITSGPLSGGIEVNVNIEPTAGPHRISARAVRPDGVPYGGGGSLAANLFWLDDGEPAVALVRPWPGAEFPLGTPTIEVEVATLNFDMRGAQMQVTEGVGHAHVHYDDPFPACSEDPPCDGGYITIVAPPGSALTDRATAMTLLPESAATMATMTAVLRNDDHSAYRFPFGSDDGRTIFNTIPILRVAGAE